MKYFFYKISSDEHPNDLYVGSTVNYNRRLYNHKYNCNTQTRKHYNYRLYRMIRERGGWNNFKMEALEECEVINAKEALKIEQRYINELKPNMNSVNAYNR